MSEGCRIRILRIDEVSGLVGLSASTIRLMEKGGEFPSRVRLGKRSVGWREGDVLGWLKSRESGFGPAPSCGKAELEGVEVMKK